MTTREDRIKAALQGTTRTTDPAKVWREHFAGSQITYQEFRRVADVLASVPPGIVKSLLDTSGTMEDRFHQAQPEYVSIDEFRGAWVEHCHAAEAKIDPAKAKKETAEK